MLRGDVIMTGSGPAVLSQALAEKPETEVIETRFGKVTLYRKNPIIFPTGLLGMPDKMQFCLSAFPSPKFARFKLLQSLEEEKLSLITLPVDLDNPVVAREDVMQAAKDLAIPLSQLALLLIVSVHRETGAARLSVNARAPIFMDASRRLATQYVFPHGKYDIRHMIGL